MSAENGHFMIISRRLFNCTDFVSPKREKSITVEFENKVHLGGSIRDLLYAEQ
jgi:hypothetical protein